jgi:DNA-directed RNA polymerase specialized sigma24 family protein
MRGPGESGLSPPNGDAPGNGTAPGRQQLCRLAERRGMPRRSGIGKATEAGAVSDLALSALEFALGRKAVRRYEEALVRLRPRDRQAVLGRIELRWSYGQLAEALGVRTAERARASVTRAVRRLVEVMSE